MTDKPTQPLATVTTHPPAAPPDVEALFGGLMTALKSGDASPEDMRSMIEMTRDLYRLQREAQQDANRAAFAAALAATQAAVGAVPHDAWAKDRAGNPTYSYASLPQLHRYVIPQMSRHGLAGRYSMRESNDGWAVVYTLTHVATGYFEEAVVPWRKFKGTSISSDSGLVAGGATSARRLAMKLAFDILDEQPAPSPHATTEPISADQHAHLEQLLKDLQVLQPKQRGRVYKYFSVDHLDQLPSLRYQEAVEFIEGLLERARGEPR